MSRVGNSKEASFTDRMSLDKAYSRLLGSSTSFRESSSLCLAQIVVSKFCRYLSTF